MYGDLIFYRPAKRNLFGRLIAHCTKGDFSHVSISMTLFGMPGSAPDAANIGAHLDGIRISETALEGGEKVTAAVPADLGAKLKGVAWAFSHLNMPYGKQDILSNVLKLFGCPFYIGQRDHYDCSEFAARYLQECGVELPEALEEALPLVSPNDLARFLGIIQ